MSKDLRVGITGSGGISHIHAQTYSANEHTELVACCDIDFFRAEALAANWNCNAYASQEEMLQNEQLDIVSLCTQPRSHRMLGVQALEAGMHLFCEKPLACSAAEGQAMVDAARVNGKKLMVAVCHRFHEPVVRAKALLQEGKLGELRGYHNAHVGAMGWKDRGGVLLDNGSHAVDHFRHLVGEAKDVSAIINPPSDDITDAHTAWVLLETADGVPGTINLSFDVQGGGSMIALFGNEGTAVVDYSLGGLRYKLGDDDWVHEQYEDLPGDHRFHREIAHFVDCILNDTEPVPNGEEGIKDLELIEAIWNAARRG